MRISDNPRGFTLVEMLAVMGIIVLIISIVTPTVTYLSGANDVNKAVYDITGTLEQARAYAMSSNTYVYVGFQEADATTSDSGRQKDGVGRVSVGVIARRDGTRGYDPNTQNPSVQDAWKNNYGTGGNYFAVGKVQHFNNLHIVDLKQPPTSSDPPYSQMIRPAVTPVPDQYNNLVSYNLGDTTDCQPVTSFDLPLGNAIGSGQYTFNMVIQFDPQGVARVQQARNGDTIAQAVEIGLEQTHGTAAPSPSPPVKSGPVAAIQIDPMTGATHIYRP